MSVDILPASLPLDASVHFSGVFLPYLERLVGQYIGERDDGVDEALERATIAEGGGLKEKHRWLQSAVDAFYETEGRKKGVFTPSAGAGDAAPKVVVDKGKREMQSGVLRKKRVLMLGSGMVAGPAVDAIAKRGDVQLLIGLSISSRYTQILTSSLP